MKKNKHFFIDFINKLYNGQTFNHLPRKITRYIKTL